jgi:hypothetical protein
MAGKKVFMLRVNPEIYEALEKWAADEFRSVNGQLEWIIDKALIETGRTPRKKTPSPDIQVKKNDNL